MEDKQLLKASKIALIILLLSILFQFIKIHEIYWEEKPFESDDGFYGIIKPYIYKGKISTTSSILALILYFYRKYLFVIVVCIITIIWQAIYTGY